jgi:pimeloyl-ACP methyl ester carboxylesterase
MGDSTVTSHDGVRLVVRRLGRGSPVVFLHGSNGGCDSLAAVAEPLAAGWQPWLVARRGYHPSDLFAGEKSFAQEVADVRALVDHAHRASGLPVHLVGG